MEFGISTGYSKCTNDILQIRWLITWYKFTGVVAGKTEKKGKEFLFPKLVQENRKKMAID
jgi:hypothetical protein